MRTRPWITGLALSSLVVCVGCVSGDELKRVEDEVGDLKLEVFKLRSQVEEGNKKADEDRSANAEGRTQDRRFQADLQETMRQLQDTTRVLSNRMGDAGVRRSAGSGRAAAPAPVAVAEPAPVGDEEKAFTAAVLDYNRGNYALAAEGLSLFLKANPQAAQRPDALFYLGLCFFNQKLYDKAKPSFEQILREHASSSQFLPAKLKRAQCLQRMGLKPAAITAFKEITNGFPGSPEARTAQQELADLGF
ncbi:MAG: tetratricopeptide repeat protein [Holophaga sp.]|nr:tetratricopeptide repeat protein [Holophaga sp.]